MDPGADGTVGAAARRAARRRRAVTVARGQGEMVSRRQLLAAGVTRWEITAELRAGRWRRVGRQTVQVSTSVDVERPADQVRGAWFRALFEVQADAALDGATALQAAGLRNFSSGVHVSVSKGTRYVKARGVVVHETRRRRVGDLVPDSQPRRVKPAAAAVRAALWAVSDRQAALVLAMSVQQRIVSVADLWTEVETVRRARRRNFIRQIVRDIADGAESLGELDFTRLCRKHGLPAPERQAVRVLPGGRAFLDAEWKQYGVAVEIDGSQHHEPAGVVADAIRQNDVASGRTKVLRIPLLGLRIAADQFIHQLGGALTAGGWLGHAVA